VCRLYCWVYLTKPTSAPVANAFHPLSGICYEELTAVLKWVSENDSVNKYIFTSDVQQSKEIVVSFITKQLACTTPSYLVFLSVQMKQFNSNVIFCKGLERSGKKLYFASEKSKLMNMILIL